MSLSRYPTTSRASLTTFGLRLLGVILLLFVFVLVLVGRKVAKRTVVLTFDQGVGVSWSRRGVWSGSCLVWRNTSSTAIVEWASV